MDRAYERTKPVCSLRIRPDVPPTVGRYAIRGVLGKGSSSVVYRAWDPKFEREGTWKFLQRLEPITITEVEE